MTSFKGIPLLICVDIFYQFIKAFVNPVNLSDILHCVIVKQRDLKVIDSRFFLNEKRPINKNMQFLRSD